MLKLNSEQRSQLRSLAHSLDPVVMIGDAGLTDAVLKEIDVSLNAHELIKIRVFGDDRQARLDMLESICEQMEAAPIQHIGKLLVIYRPKKEESQKPLSTDKKGKGLRTTTTFKPGSGSIKNRVKKVVLKGNERVTAGGLVKRSKARPASAKKKALAK
ncbi:ribosome assembly RNA-binding protein YhbY [Oxalobacter formigenes]|uniref:RNA-binding protein, YhbY family n=1 Tax=Oxalobacter formigenes OXCC13 TaxID=556269 RepID=C3XAB1_OXAFO|nr:ribosome assembly RNA-binding protein YhbY [Oxalobacter formigenes]ARQ45719.1 RNA-binding protein [Oxalobacter formigenes]ARQ77958.1 RNA-binding protein [Oxalobacter formigenes OXCC13]EEO30137.1 RNA-binding protein, YhbY family [Oxalobacter formigenes OXCC13]MCZ4063119.1 ribosome assembly RNA-binding protein YhbY [Oxalobacter formigenes]QDX33492.1 ribosome assembly RNA-binding protein YhbY [Oxalobacter formigenes]